MRVVRMVVLGALLLGLAGCTWNTFETPLALSRVNSALHAGVEDVTVRLNQAAFALRGVAPGEGGAALEALCSDLPAAQHCVTLDGLHVVTAVAPTTEDALLRSAAHPWQNQAPEEPVSASGVRKNLACSQVYRSPAGYDGLDVGVALEAGDSGGTGEVAVTLRLADWLGELITPTMAGLPVEIWVMQPDGLILYDANPEEVGRNLFADPLYSEYPSLLELGKEIAAEEQGGGEYTFLRKDMQEPVKKTATWTTFEFCGQPWRIILAHGGMGRDEVSLVDDPGPDAAQDALRKLAADPVLSDALATGDWAWGRTAFRSLYDAYPNVYAVQFVDKDGINQFGYPPENSLQGYDFRTLQLPGDDNFLAAVQLEHEAKFETPLVEGSTGHFFLEPVYQGSEYLGMIYTVQTDR